MDRSSFDGGAVGASDEEERFGSVVVVMAGYQKELLSFRKFDPGK